MWEENPAGAMDISGQCMVTSGSPVTSRNNDQERQMQGEPEILNLD
jgi:hypothetical protein